MPHWYLKKEWVDRDSNIETVHIHYAWMPPGQPPAWNEAHGRLPLSIGGALLRGTAPALPAGAPPLPGDIRHRVLALPFAVFDQERAEWTANYTFHYYFEVFQAGNIWTTEAFEEEIVYRDLEYVDWEGRLSAVNVYWSVADWEAPAWMPTEDPRFDQAFGPQHERCAASFYHFPDKAWFAMEKWNLMRQLPLPWRWTGRIYGPKGASVRQRWHLGNLSPGMDWEDWDPHPPGDFIHYL